MDLLLQLDDAVLEGNPDPVASLQSAWINEKLTPELLPFHDTHAVQELLNTIDDMENPHHIVILQADRVRFLLNAYLRRRILKIQRFCMHILSTSASERLSDAEAVFAEQYVDLMYAHLTESFLKNIPERFQALDGDALHNDMIETPDLTSYVFIKMLTAVGLFEIDRNEQVPLYKNDILLVRYDNVLPLISQGTAVLI